MPLMAVQRRTLILAVTNLFRDCLLLLTCPGLANILIFRSCCSLLVDLVEETDNDDASVKIVAKKILKDIKQCELDSSCYSCEVDKSTALNQSSETLIKLLSHVSDKLNGSLPALLIGNIITSAVKNRATMLQVALGVAVREKQLIQMFHDFLVTSTYDEVLRFKTSAAWQVSREREQEGLFDKMGSSKLLSITMMLTLHHPMD